MTQGAYLEAYEAYEQAVYINGHCSPLWLSVGVLYFHIKHFDDCLDAFLRSTHLDPYNIDAWRNLGIVVSNLSHRDIKALLIAFSA